MKKQTIPEGTPAPRKRDTGRAFWFPATLAPFSLNLSHLRPLGGVILQPPTTLPPSVRQRSDMGRYVSAVGGMGEKLFFVQIVEVKV